MTDAEDIIRLLDLNPHPEGGYYRETLRAPAMPGERAAGTAIYFLLAAGEVSAWHRVDAAEAWHWYAGARHPGQHLETGQRPQIVVPSHAWQTAESLGAWTPAGCTVSQTRCRNLSAPRPGLHVRRNPPRRRPAGDGTRSPRLQRWQMGRWRDGENHRRDDPAYDCQTSNCAGRRPGVPGPPRRSTVWTIILSSGVAFPIPRNAPRPPPSSGRR